MCETAVINDSRIGIKIDNTHIGETSVHKGRIRTCDSVDYSSTQASAHSIESVDTA